MKSREFSRGVAPLILIGALGFTGCSSSTQESGRPDSASTDTCTDPQPLQSLSVESYGKDPADAVKVVNTGECAAIYDPDTLQTIGTIASNEVFYTVCRDEKPNSFEVATGDITGYVNYGNGLKIDHSAAGTRPTPLPEC
jgi:hypothetical protein